MKLIIPHGKLRLPWKEIAKRLKKIVGPQKRSDMLPLINNWQAVLQDLIEDAGIPLDVFVKCSTIGDGYPTFASYRNRLRWASFGPRNKGNLPGLLKLFRLCARALEPIATQVKSQGKTC